MLKKWLVAGLLALSVIVAEAQITGPEVVHQGPIVNGNCAAWAGPLAIKDSGVAC